MSGTTPNRGYMVLQETERSVQSPSRQPSDIEEMNRAEMMAEIERLRGQIGGLLEQRDTAISQRDAAISEKMEAEKRAAVDALTGFYNKGFYTEHMPKLLARAERESLPCDLLVLDIDHFKSVNDTFGHAAGDAVLKEVSSIIQKSLRAEDIGFRYGGEEFVVFLQNTQHGDGLMVAERIRKAVEDAKIEHEGKTIPATLSIGVSSFAGQNEKSLFNEADKALYKAKNSGRNRIVSSPNTQMTRSLQGDIAIDSIRTETGS